MGDLAVGPRLAGRELGTAATGRVCLACSTAHTSVHRARRASLDGQRVLTTLGEGRADAKPTRAWQEERLQLRCCARCSRGLRHCCPNAPSGANTPSRGMRTRWTALRKAGGLAGAKLLRGS